MADPLIRKIKKGNLNRRLRIYRVLVYVAAAIALAAFAFCIIDYQGWIWILIGVLYALFSFHFVQQQKAIKEELRRREEWRAARAKADQ
jgi:fatty acid desaturase